MNRKSTETLTESQKKVAGFLTRPPLVFSQEWEGESLARSKARSEDALAKKYAKIKTGDVMPDGTIYLGFLNKKDWFVAVEDAKGAEGWRVRMTFNQAARYAKDLRAHGHDDWIVPPSDDPGESNVLQRMFNARSQGAFKGTYEERAGAYNSWYWSSTTEGAPRDCAFQQKFDYNNRVYSAKDDPVYVRCIRAVPRS